MSDSNGCIYDKDGIKLDVVKRNQGRKRGRIKEYLKSVPSAQYMENNGETPAVYTIKADVVLPCATQNDINLNAAKVLLKTAQKQWVKALICLAQMKLLNIS